MRQRLVGEQVALPLGMVGRVAWFAACAGAAGYGAHAEARLAQARGHERHDAEQHRRRKTAGLGGVARVDRLGVFGNGAGEPAQELRPWMRLAVNRRKRLGVGKPEVGRRVDDGQLDAGLRCPIERLADDLR